MNGAGGYACRDITLCTDIAGGQCFSDDNCGGNQGGGGGDCAATMTAIPDDAVAELFAPGRTASLSQPPIIFGPKHFQCPGSPMAN